jgi:2-polyprenyl-6-methoxyphenol hydroxylase-like FAD-dependent oxidoreductase
LEVNPTKRPSAETAGLKESPFPLAPVAPVARLTSVVVSCQPPQARRLTNSRREALWRLIL